MEEIVRWKWLWPEHRAVVARDDNNCIVDFNKKTNTATIRLRTPRQHAAVLSHLQTYSWDSVCSATEVQQAADLFYDQMKTIVDDYYPMSTITTTSRDPGFVTPEVKSMLRKKNYLMRRGRIEEANSIVKRVSKIIIEHNSVCFKGLNSRVDTRELWSNVNKVLGKTRKISNILVDSKICAESLNTHYAKLSTDANYVVSCTKLTAYDCDNDDFMDEMTVFRMLDKLKPTAAGTDDLPYWILKLTACSIAKPVAHIYNLSMLSSLQPSQWKQAIITPIPKIPSPLSEADFRPISLTPILARNFEKNIIRAYIYPILQDSTTSKPFLDQFAFRPTGSTEAALISILHHVTHLLAFHQYVRLIALDFSKAFDTLRHCTILSKLSLLPLPDHVYNWFVNYFKDHTHTTNFDGKVSKSASINASVFQGSAVGPAMFVVNGSDLKPITTDNYIDKYADDTYLIVPSGNEESCTSELTNIESWAQANNLTLNKKKSFEMIIFPNERQRSAHPPVALIPNIDRVDSLKILGVIIGKNLSMKEHIDAITASAAQSLYAIKLLRSHGLDAGSCNTVCRATVVAKLTYAAPSWWGFASASEKQRLQAIVNRAIKWGYYNANNPSLEEICEKRETEFFEQIQINPTHILHQFLPSLKPTPYSFRPRSHNFYLPDKKNSLINKNFINRMLYKDIFQ